MTTVKTKITDSDPHSCKILDPHNRIQMFEVHSNFEKRSEVNIRKKVNLLNFSHLKSSKQPKIGSNNFLRPHLILILIISVVGVCTLVRVSVPDGSFLFEMLTPGPDSEYVSDPIQVLKLHYNFKNINENACKMFYKKIFS